MTRNGKIARLPADIRDQLNLRLYDGEPASALLEWLNSLPEVRAVLHSLFADAPINPVNLSDWRSGGYRDWLARQEASELASALQDSSPGSPNPPDADLLARWLLLQYAAATRLLDPENPAARWDQLRQFSADICRLRRADFAAQRLGLARARLTLDEANSAAAKEQQFWTWTKRPDVHDKLYPQTIGIAEIARRLGDHDLAEMYDRVFPPEPKTSPPDSPHSSPQKPPVPPGPPPAGPNALGPARNALGPAQVKPN